MWWERTTKWRSCIILKNKQNSIKLWRYKQKHTDGAPPVGLWGKVPIDVGCWLNEKPLGSIAFASESNDANPDFAPEKENCADCDDEVELLFVVVDGMFSD